MKCSNIEKGLRTVFSQDEMDEIHDKCGMISHWSLKQTGPLEFMLTQAEEGKGVMITASGGSSEDHPHGVIFKADRPKTLNNRFWGMAPVKTVIVLRQGIKFEPDMSSPVTRRARGTEAERIHARAASLEPAKDTGALMSLREFTQAVDKINQFVTENAGHVVLELRNGLLKFLVEG